MTASRKSREYNARLDKALAALNAEVKAVEVALLFTMPQTVAELSCILELPVGRVAAALHVLNAHGLAASWYDGVDLRWMRGDDDRDV